jgi:pimeloyl-ACP methyl ester carboxylesterase
MTEFRKCDLLVDGVRVQVIEAGKGKPLIYFHGAGAGGGFDELLPLAEKHRLIVPVHPGFGGSDDDLTISSVFDYVVHYATLFDALKLHEPVDLVGHSLGGWIASLFTIFQGHRVHRLVLACPAGLRVPEHPGVDLFMIAPEDLPSTLAASPMVLAKMTQSEVTVDMKVARYREMTSLARVIWERSCDPKLDRWLKHVSVPTLILWGEQDKILPVQQAQCWADRLGSGAEIAIFNGVGHLVFLESPRAVKRVASFLKVEAYNRLEDPNEASE